MVDNGGIVVISVKCEKVVDNLEELSFRYRHGSVPAAMGICRKIHEPER